MAKLSSNFKWLKNIETKNQAAMQKLMERIEKIESRIEHSDFSIGTEARKALEYAFIIFSEKTSIILSESINSYIYKHKPDSTVFCSLKAVQKLGNSDSHAATEDLIKIETESAALSLLKDTHNAMVGIFYEIDLLNKKTLENISFDFRVYINEVSHQKQKQKEYTSAISASTINSFTVGFVDYILDVENNFYIPHYQRDYSWTQKEIDYLFNDLKKRYRDSKPHHMGVIALSQNKIEDNKRIIDGQQRITSFLMLVKAYKEIFAENEISHKYNEFNNWDSIVEFKYKNAKNKTLESIQGILKSTNNKSNSTDINLLKSNYNEIRSQILSLKKYDKISFQEQYNILKEKFLITPFIHKDLSTKQELEVFENLNSKGKPLSDSDLIENFQILSIKKQEIDNEQRIREILDIYINNVIKNAFPKEKNIEKKASNFYEYYNAYQLNIKDFKEKAILQIDKKIKTYKVYNQFKDLWNLNDMSINEFESEIKKINKYLKIWLLLETQEYQLETNKIFSTTKDNINTLNNKKVYYPLFTYVLEETADFNEDNTIKSFKSPSAKKAFENCLKILEIYFIRLIGPGTGQSLANLFNEAIHDLKKSSIKSLPSKLWQYFNHSDRGRNKMPDKSTFEKSISNFRFAKWAQKAVLVSVEKYLHNIDNKYKNQTIAYKSSNLEIEHIAPVKAKTKFQNYEEIIEMIGNKTLLDSDTNKKIKNKLFAQKKSEYPKNTKLIMGNGGKFKIKSIFKYENWNEETIESRSKEIAKIAVLGPLSDYE